MMQPRLKILRVPAVRSRITSFFLVLAVCAAAALLLLTVTAKAAKYVVLASMLALPLLALSACVRWLGRIRKADAAQQYSIVVLKSAVKRGIDISVSGVLLILVAPIIGCVALVLRVSSKGPVLFRQIRSGRNGQQFVLYKFRTMTVSGEAQPLATDAGPVLMPDKDPRVTSVGRLLKRYSLDELPLLWNVLRGDMSLVGPRPARPSEVEEQAPWQARLLSMRPGLTSLVQVAAHEEVDFERRLELDLEYVESWTFSLDLMILAKTMQSWVLGRAAS